jgi:hypothetical protein
MALSSTGRSGWAVQFMLESIGSVLIVVLTSTGADISCDMA